jgi:hypothetical protein
MKYQCCVCDFSFESTQIKDDFKNGVKVGFLCPKCGANIKDDLNGQTSFDKKANGTFLLYAFLIAIFFFDSEIEQYISNPLGINNWVFLGFLILVLVSIYAIVNKGLIREANTFTTKRVTHNKPLKQDK